MSGEGQGGPADPGGAFDAQWEQSREAAASKPEPSLQETVDEAMRNRAG